MINNGSHSNTRRIIINLLVNTMASIRLIRRLFPPPPFRMTRLRSTTPRTQVHLTVVLLNRLSNPLPTPITKTMSPIFLPTTTRKLLHLLTLFLYRNFRPLFPSTHQTGRTTITLLSNRPRRLQRFFNLARLRFALVFRLTTRNIINSTRGVNRVTRFRTLTTSTITSRRNVNREHFSFQFYIRDIRRGR